MRGVTFVKKTADIKNKTPDIKKKHPFLAQILYNYPMKADIKNKTYC